MDFFGGVRIFLAGKGILNWERDTGWKPVTQVSDQALSDSHAMHASQEKMSRVSSPRFPSHSRIRAQLPDVSIGGLLEKQMALVNGINPIYTRALCFFSKPTKQDTYGLKTYFGSEMGTDLSQITHGASPPTAYCAHRRREAN